jgi:hypothetical protein
MPNGFHVVVRGKELAKTFQRALGELYALKFDIEDVNYLSGILIPDLVNDSPLTGPREIAMVPLEGYRLPGVRVASHTDQRFLNRFEVAFRRKEFVETLHGA